MKTIIFTRYGSPDSLSLRELDKPQPQHDEVLVRVCAASINEWDWAVLQGVPFANRVTTGLFRPHKQLLGADVAGVVEAVGAGVTRFVPGDAVLGDLCRSAPSGIPQYHGGTFAEYVCARETHLLHKPPQLDFVQAAALPQAGALAMQGLENVYTLPPGSKVLINGASGGVGTLAVQIAVSAGAEVTGVCSAAKMDLVRRLGATRVIDYGTENYTRGTLQYDLILDVMGFHSLFAVRRVLSRNGCYIMLGGGSKYAMQVMFLGRLYSRISGRQFALLIYKPNRGLAQLLDLVAAGSVSPVIDEIFPLARTADAFHYYGAGRARGKVIVMPEPHRQT